MRKSLYVKDDDFRLSFLHGNYITLTDLDEHELARIEAQRLSPLYISVHATDSALRHRLLGEPRGHAVSSCPSWSGWPRPGIRMHAQIVLVPGLERRGAPRALGARARAICIPAWPRWRWCRWGSRAIANGYPSSAPITAVEARDACRDHRGLADAGFWTALGTRFVWAADEVYLQAGLPLPPATAYEGFPVVEDGVGLVRRFSDGFAARRAVAASGRSLAPRAVRW